MHWNKCTAIQPAVGSIPGYEERLQPVRNADAANLSAALLGLQLIPASQIKTILHVNANSVTPCHQTTSAITPLLFDD